MPAAVIARPTPCARSSVVYQCRVLGRFETNKQTNSLQTASVGKQLPAGEAKQTNKQTNKRKFRARCACCARAHTHIHVHKDKVVLLRAHTSGGGSTTVSRRLSSAAATFLRELLRRGFTFLSVPPRSALCSHELHLLAQCELRNQSQCSQTVCKH